jgi:hypothetical protein
MGVYPLSQNAEGRRTYDCEAISSNHVFAPGVSAEMIAADPDAARPQWVVPTRFWQDLGRVLSRNPTVGAADAAMAEQARTLVALHASDPAWAAVLDEAAAALRTSARYEQVGVDAGNGWQRQENGGLWGTDWFGQAQAAVVYILVNDYHEAVYLIRGTDAKGTLLDGRHAYTMTFPAPRRSAARHRPAGALRHSLVRNLRGRWRRRGAVLRSIFRHGFAIEALEA